jgi:hypothetical protein
LQTTWKNFSAMHRIQLKGPWEYRPLSIDQGLEIAIETGHSASVPPESLVLPGPGTIKFPVSWEEFLGDFYGIVEFRRPFNCPTNLTSDDRVDLVLGGIGGDAHIVFNGISLGSIADKTGYGRFDITPHLRLHNVIRVTVTRLVGMFDPCGLWGPVSLEIHDKKLEPKCSDAADPTSQPH